jgi:pyrroline-5-carboxylate reductase
MASGLSVTLIGCGKMGSAMLRGWLAAGLTETIYVLEPSGLPDEFKDDTRVHLLPSAVSLAKPDIVVLAVKPQIMNEVCQSIKNGITASTLILSIAAGQKIAGFEKQFGTGQPIIRCMPNTPASIGQGITVAVANPRVSVNQRQVAEILLRSIGMVEWIDDERHMDAVTALSGSGPAYVFYLIEILAKAGAASGLEPDFAMRLARQTVIGSAALAAAESDVPAATLRKNVTSPGGTTEAALKTLMDQDALQNLFGLALKRATDRSVELSK